MAKGKPQTQIPRARLVRMNEKPLLIIIWYEKIIVVVVVVVVNINHLGVSG